MRREIALDGLVATLGILALILGVLFIGECAVQASTPTLGDRAVEFMRSRPGGAGRAQREAEWIRELAGWATEAPAWEGDPDAPTLLALSFYESAWKPAAINDRTGAWGLMQILGAAAAGVPRKPRDGFEAGADWLRHFTLTCGDLGEGLTGYLTGECGRPGRRVRLVMRWAREMRAE